jgi:uncharacterized membrane protein
MNELLSGAHPHLLVNHVPIMGAFFGLALLIASYLFAADVLRRTAFAVLIVTALAASASDLSGDAAEDAVKGLPGVTRERIQAHKDIAETSYILAGVVGVLALGALVRWRRAPVPPAAAHVILVGAAVVSGLMAYTGLLGGRVRHTEVRPGAVPADAMIVEPSRPERRGQGGP